MVSALVYLQVRTMVNRLVFRVRRLRQPKYLFGGLVGALYFYFYFFRYLWLIPGVKGPGPGPGSDAGAGAQRALFELIGAAIFLVAVIFAWLLPNQRAALAFTEAEVAFLFPAPITRRGLIHFKLLRSQGGILFTTFVLMLVTNRFGRLSVHAVGWWLILSTFNLHLLGSSFARTQLLDRGITNRQRRLLVIGLVLLVATIVVLWVRRSLPAPDAAQLQGMSGVQDYVISVLTSGPLPWLLYPFRLLVRPYLATNAASFVAVLWPALGLLALHYVWVMRSDVAFEEASLEASRRTAQKLAALRAGELPTSAVAVKGRRAPFVLNGTGSPAVAFLWKNLISAGQAFTPRLWLLVAGSAMVSCVFLSRRSDHSDLVSAAGLAAAMLVAWSFLLGPQLFRQDLRQDLPLADVLKMYPVRGWELVLGELLAPASILTGVQWLLLLISALLLWNAPNSYLDRGPTMALEAGAALVVPVLNLIILQIPNAAVVLFPAWVHGGKDRAHGIELTGQRIIAIIAQALVLCAALIPGALVWLGICYLADRAGLREWGILIGSVAATGILAAEAALGLALLGRLFERFDLSAELPLI